MNFTSPSDFQFVTGDLDKIEIDNDIMPVRSSTDKRIIRGMDIAFLMEAVEERRRAVGEIPIAWNFSKSITASQFALLKNEISTLFGVNHLFLKRLPDSAWLETSDPSPIDSCILSQNDMPPLPNVHHGSPIMSNDVMLLYDAVAMLKMFVGDVVSQSVGRSVYYNHFQQLNYGEIIHEGEYELTGSYNEIREDYTLGYIREVGRCLAMPANGRLPSTSQFMNSDLHIFSSWSFLYSGVNSNSESWQRYAKRSHTVHEVNEFTSFDDIASEAVSFAKGNFSFYHDYARCNFTELTTLRMIGGLRDRTRWD